MVTYTAIWDLIGPLDPAGNPTGPVKVELNTILAREAMDRDPKRYAYQLPKNARPGVAEEARLQRIADIKRDFDATALAHPDPHFPPDRRPSP